MITIIWTATASAQLNNPNNGYTQTGIIVIRNHIQNWVLTSANNWQLNTTHTFEDPSLKCTATARLNAIVGNNRTVSITNFQP